MSQSERILRLHEAMERTGLSRSSIYAYKARGAFPEAIKLGPRSIGFLESEVQAWIDRRIEESRQAA